MFIPNSYNEVLHESKSSHHLIGSAWSVVSIVAAAALVISTLSYLA
nr:hypothetical protein [uncultured Dongia sp.]